LENSKPYNIDCNWDSNYLCKKCGSLLYYTFITKEINCLNVQCKDFPSGVELFSTKEADLTLLNKQSASIEKALGQIVNTCDYNRLVMQLLENRKQIIDNFITSGIMPIDEFLISNEILFFVKKHKSLGMRNDKLTFNGFLQLFISYYHNLTLIENIKEG
jgi:hypothetical protein